MDNDMEEDSIYANDETKDLINVSNLLQHTSLEDLLKRDKAEVKEKESDLHWYHGRIARDVSEDILKKGLIKYGNIDGLFLVRESSFSSSSFVLSLVCKGSFYHFQVNEVKSSHFSIDEGPITQGLDKLMCNYQVVAEGLPTKLIKSCKCKPPPDEFRYSGTTNILHRAVLENVPEIVARILDSKDCPPINAKNEWGSTAVHDACHHGFEDVADLLVRKGASVNIFDKNGQTPLHRCCSNNKAGSISILVQEGKANVNQRNPKSDWTPLHHAAFKGSLECIKILLDFHSPYLPRAEDGTTPLDLAENYEHTECFNEIDNFDPPKVSTHKKDWYHPEVDRPAAQRLLELKGLREGLFLVRKSRRHPDWLVLTLCHSQKVFNYEIKTKHYRDRMMYYIDDGPYYTSLEHLVHYYSFNANGLPCQIHHYRDRMMYYIDDGPYYKSLEHLVHYYSFNANGLPCQIHVSINTSKELIQITDDDEYFNLVDHNAKRSPNLVTPELPPRPEVDDVVPLYAQSARRPDSINRGNDAKLSPPPSPGIKPSPPPPPNHPPPARQTSTAQAAPVELTRLDRKLITLGKEIGQGEFGKVVKGLYKTGTGRKKEKQEVAIKLFHKTAINNREDFLKEARTMQLLQHRFIVNFIGIAETDKHELMLVEEFISKGSMLDYLIDYKDRIDKKELYLWASQIAEGMSYLEEQKFVHRDLAARNILLQTSGNKKQAKVSEYEAKISDFGLSRAVGTNSDYYQATTGGRWPIKWYAPECVNYGQFSHASDVWSFGVTLWEMFTFGEPPYGDMKGIEVIKYIEDEKRLLQPDKCPDACYSQMLACWRKEAKKRPSFWDLNEHFLNDDEYMSIRAIREMRAS